MVCSTAFQLAGARLGARPRTERRKVANCDLWLHGGWSLCPKFVQFAITNVSNFWATTYDMFAN